MKNLLDRIVNHELISEDEIIWLCNKAIEVLIHEPNILRLRSPVVVVGDIHGQFSDLLTLLQIEGGPEKSTYIFLGDYVDRGYNSLSCILLLLTYKVLYPQKIYLLRGNHEQKPINKVYGFYDECLMKYNDLKVYNALNMVFSHLNIGAIVDNRYLCVHGGISPRISISKLDRIDRFEKIAEDSLFNDVLWSDPYYRNGASFNPRGCGYLFGEDVLKQFLIYNNLEAIIRSHQLAIEGYKWDFDGLCLTVWSAPDYMGKCLNPATILVIEKDGQISRSNLRLFKKSKKDHTYIQNKNSN